MSEPERRSDWQRTPHHRRLSPEHARYNEIIERHDAAIDRGFPTYADPVSGFSVFTAVFLSKRGYCCESGCRHCPFEI